MGLRLRLNRLERQAAGIEAQKCEAWRREEDEKRAAFYRDNPEARRAKIMEVLARKAPPEPESGTTWAKKCPALTQAERYLQACQRRREQSG